MHPQTKTPLLLDEQTRSYGLMLLDRLKMQMTEPERYRKMLAKEAQPTAEQSWGGRYLSDMHPANSMPPDTLLPILMQQIEKLEATGDHIAQAEKILSTDAMHRVSSASSASTLQFFRANLTAQHQILLGLNRWLEAVILARFAADEGNKQATQKPICNAPYNTYSKYKKPKPSPQKEKNGNTGTAATAK